MFMAIVMPYIWTHMLLNKTKEKIFFLIKVTPRLQDSRVGTRAKNSSITASTNYPHTTLRSLLVEKIFNKKKIFFFCPPIFSIFDHEDGTIPHDA